LALGSGCLSIPLIVTPIHVFADNTSKRLLGGEASDVRTRMDAGAGILELRFTPLG